jgi:hypothetical protein
VICILTLPHSENIREKEVCCRTDGIVTSAGYKFAANQILRLVKQEIIVHNDRGWYELNILNSRGRLWMQTPFWPKVSKESLGHVWEVCIKINLGETGYVIVDWMHLVQSGNSDDSRNVISGFKDF